jgi:hypothetical protein
MNSIIAWTKHGDSSGCMNHWAVSRCLIITSLYSFNQWLIDLRNEAEYENKFNLYHVKPINIKMLFHINIRNPVHLCHMKLVTYKLAINVLSDVLVCICKYKIRTHTHNIYIYIYIYICSKLSYPCIVYQDISLSGNVPHYGSTIHVWCVCVCEWEREWERDRERDTCVVTIYWRSHNIKSHTYAPKNILSWTDWRKPWQFSQDCICIYVCTYIWNWTQNHSSTPRHTRFSHSTVSLWENHTQPDPLNHKERI